MCWNDEEIGIIVCVGGEADEKLLAAVSMKGRIPVPTVHKIHP